MGIKDVSKPSKDSRLDKPFNPRWKLTGKHCFNVQPLGNKYLNPEGQDARENLGNLMILPDPILLDIVHSLELKGMANFAQTCKAAMILVYTDDPWRLKTILRFGSDWKWDGNWRRTYKLSTHLSRNLALEKLVKDGPIISPTTPFYSDTLFQSWYCANLDLDQFIPVKPTLEKVEADNLSIEDFVEKFAKPGKPVIISGLLKGSKHCPAWNCSTWTPETLLEKYPQVKMRAESCTLTLQDYFHYASTTNEESPLYIFDKDFGEKWNLAPEDFQMPSYFPSDLFQGLVNRPDYQWIIMGPPRSGSTFHIDPNSTSAYNALIHGRKLWVFYPPNHTPPGVFVSPDGSEVSAPVSTTEWWSNYIHQARRDGFMLEGVQNAGDVVYVPNGWWHTVLNLDSTIAITQNFVDEHNFISVLKFLRDKRDQVSGYGTLDWCEEDPDTSMADNDLYEQFCKILQRQHPELMKRWKSVQVERKRPREEVTETWKDLQRGTSFSFGFSTLNDNE